MKIAAFGWTLTVRLEDSSVKLRKRLQSLIVGDLRIQAIKEYRAATGSCLKDAVTFVDALPKLPPFLAQKES